MYTHIYIYIYTYIYIYVVASVAREVAYHYLTTWQPG